MNLLYDKVKIKKELTCEDLFEMIRDGIYPVGAPELTETGTVQKIFFQATGKYRIEIAIKKNIITISKSYYRFKNSILKSKDDELTDGWYRGMNQENLAGNQAIQMIGLEISRILQEQKLLDE